MKLPISNRACFVIQATLLAALVLTGSACGGGGDSDDAEESWDELVWDEDDWS